MQTLKPKGVTVSALLAKAVAICLEKHPIVNAAYDPSGAIKYNEDINVAMAVALDGGLITPTLRKANTMDIYSLGREWKDLVGKAKAVRVMAQAVCSLLCDANALAPRSSPQQTRTAFTFPNSLKTPPSRTPTQNPTPNPTNPTQKKLTPDEYNSGTFAISNLGMFGVSSFEAILPPGMGE